MREISKTCQSDFAPSAVTNLNNMCESIKDIMNRPSWSPNGKNSVKTLSHCMIVEVRRHVSVAKIAFNKQEREPPLRMLGYPRRSIYYFAISGIRINSLERDEVGTKARNRSYYYYLLRSELTISS